MPQKEIYAMPNITTPSTPVVFDPDKCTGCNQCVDHCQVDVFIPNQEAGQPPVVLHPDECWYCGVCVTDCPNDALTSNWPVQQRAYWQDKTTGKVLRDRRK